MEALACDIPVLSPQLKELGINTDELGYVLNHKEEIAEKTELMINNLHRFNSCRESAMKVVNGKDNLMVRLKTLYDSVDF